MWVLWECIPFSSSQGLNNFSVTSRQCKWNRTITDLQTKAQHNRLMEQGDPLPQKNAIYHTNLKVASGDLFKCLRGDLTSTGLMQTGHLESLING